jgi:hypothetical protein
MRILPCIAIWMWQENEKNVIFFMKIKKMEYAIFILFNC